MRLKLKLPNWLHRIFSFICFVANNFIQDDCPYRASALAFVTLLAIVPFMIVSFAILSSFPVFQDLKEPLQNFIFTNFVPNTGKIIQMHLQQFADQVSRLSILGIIFLLVTTFLLMFTIERSMNTIWRVHAHREAIAAFLLYWAILSLTPIFLGLSLAASSYIVSCSLLVNHQVPPVLFDLAPYVFSFMGFTFLYVVVPNHPIKLHHGVIAGLIATALFESAKQSFAYYLIHFNFYQLLYGAFATVPIFFIWVYWVWLITLLGAEISYALSVHSQHLKSSTHSSQHNPKTYRSNQVNKNCQKKSDK